MLLCLKGGMFTELNSINHTQHILQIHRNILINVPFQSVNETNRGTTFQMPNKPFLLQISHQSGSTYLGQNKTKYYTYFDRYICTMV